MQHHRKFYSTFASLAVAFGIAATTRAQQTAAADVNDTAVELSEFTVSATQDTGSYAVTNTLSGTRYRTDLLTLPKSVQVVTSELIQDLGARNLIEALEFTPSVSQRTYDGGTMNGTDFRFRGFANNVPYRNGFRTAGMVDTINIDRIEVIKGPSSLFSGTTSPGGVVNFITKKPTDNRRSEVSARFGSFDQMRIEATTSGPITDDRRFRYFAGAALDERETFRDFEYIDKRVLSAAVDARLTPNLYWITEAQYVDRDSNLAESRPIANPTNTEFILISRSFNPSGRNLQETDNIVFTSDFDLRINEIWSARAAYHYRQTINSNDQHVMGTTVAISPTTGQRTVSRNARNTFLSTRDSTGQAYLLGRFTYGDVAVHRLTLGGERFTGTTYNDGYQNRVLPNRLDIDNPVFDQGNPTDYNVRWRNNRQYVRWWAGSITNQIDLFDERLLLFHGVRWDDGDIVNHNLLNGSNSFTKLEDSTHSGGASYRLTPGLSIFLSYGESFQGNAGTDARGNTFAPLSGEGWDAGVKFTIRENRISGSVSIFQVQQQNILRPDIDNPGFNITSGLEESRGVEVEFVGAVTPALQLIAGYAYTDAYIKDYPDSPQLNGLRVQDTPTHSGSFWGKYRFSPETRTGWSLGAGAIYVGDRRGRFPGDAPGVRSPAFTRFDANVSYDTRIANQPVTVTLAVRNAFDKDYLLSSDAYGDPRTFDVTARFRF